MPKAKVDLFQVPLHSPLVHPRLDRIDIEKIAHLFAQLRRESLVRLSCSVSIYLASQEACQ